MKSAVAPQVIVYEICIIQYSFFCFCGLVYWMLLYLSFCFFFFCLTFPVCYPPFLFNWSFPSSLPPWSILIILIWTSAFRATWSFWLESIFLIFIKSVLKLWRKKTFHIELNWINLFSFLDNLDWPLRIISVILVLNWIYVHGILWIRAGFCSPPSSH